MHSQSHLLECGICGCHRDSVWRGRGVPRWALQFYYHFYYQLQSKVLNWSFRVAIVATLDSHGKTNEEVAWSGMWAIQNLTAGNATNAVILVEVGACAGVCQFLHALFVTLMTCLLIRQLSFFSICIQWVMLFSFLCDVRLCAAFAITCHFFSP